MRVYFYVGYPRITHVERLYTGRGGNWLGKRVSEPVRMDRGWVTPYVAPFEFNIGSLPTTILYIGCNEKGEVIAS